MIKLARWDDLLTRLGLGSDEHTFNQLEVAYSEKHRAYHTSTHIQSCLETLDTNQSLLNNADAVEMAIWFHDAIYRPYSSKNEENSAKWATNFMVENDATTELSNTVSNLIIATKHNTPIQSNDESILVDIDLAILGSDPTIYAEFERDIRIEYKNVPYFIYGRKRANLLSSFLDRPCIFSSEPFHALYERNARINLEKAIHDLLR